MLKDIFNIIHLSNLLNYSKISFIIYFKDVNMGRLLSRLVYIRYFKSLTSV